jgi:GMP synthase (glutamine-hydrolysing)
MTAPRLRAHLFVQACVRTCLTQGLFAVVARRGDPDAGAVLVKLNRGKAGFSVLSQIRTGDGEAAWMRATGPDLVAESVADSYIARQVDVDYDLWVIEIEDHSGEPPPIPGRIL